MPLRGSLIYQFPDRVDFLSRHFLVLEQMGVFEGIHAAGAGAVFVIINVAAADTVKYSNGFWRICELHPVVEVPLQQFSRKVSEVFRSIQS